MSIAQQLLIPHAGRAVMSPSQQLYNALYQEPSGYDVTLEYIDASNVYAWTHVYKRYWARWQLRKLATGFWSIYDMQVWDVLKAVINSDVGITYNGTWSTFASSGALGGAYRTNNSAGSYVEFSVTGAESLYLVTATRNSYGIAYVTIDGATTLVNELPLVGANRELDLYSTASSPVFNTRWLIASGLNPAATYTVRMARSGQKNAASSGTGMEFEGYGIEPTTINDAAIGTVTNDRIMYQYLGYPGSVYEYAISYRPTGATNMEWTGAGHSNEAIAAATFKDGSENDKAVSAETTRTSAATIILNQTGTSRHSETGATDHANVICTTTFTSAGATVYHKHTWLTNAAYNTAYPAMFPIYDFAGVDRNTAGHVAGDAAGIYDMSANDNALYGQKRSQLAAAWQAAKPFIAWLWLPDLVGVNNWTNSGRYLYIEDRSDASLNKIYAERQSGGTLNLLADDVWESTANYYVSYIPNPSTAISWI